MRKRISAVYKKYEDIILYIFYGVLTTIVSFLFQFIGKNVLNLNVMMATVVSWIAAVTFAYVTNRLRVFKSQNKGFKNVMREMLSFYAARLATLLIEMAIMVIFTDKLNSSVISVLHLDTIDYSEGIFRFAKDADNFNTFIFKVVANVIVLITNYILSKMFIFKRHTQET